MICPSCKSVLTFVDVVADVAWCKACGYKESVDYRRVRK